MRTGKSVNDYNKFLVKQLCRKITFPLVVKTEGHFMSFLHYFISDVQNQLNPKFCTSSQERLGCTPNISCECIALLSGKYRLMFNFVVFCTVKIDKNIG